VGLSQKSLASQSEKGPEEAFNAQAQILHSQIARGQRYNIDPRLLAKK